MKSFHKIVLAALLLFFFIGTLNANPEEARWKLIGKSRTDTRWYIDAETISHPSADVISVWVRTSPEKINTDYSEDDEPDIILKKIQARSFGDYEYTEGLLELDCSKAMFRLLYFCAYDKDNSIITSTLTPEAGWSFVLPGSIGETVRDTVCPSR